MMKLWFLIIISLSMISGVVAFASLRNHVISTLLSLEFASLSLYLYLFNLLIQSLSEPFIALVYLALAACEGALGLSILVTLIKTQGNDFVKSNSISQC